MKSIKATSAALWRIGWIRYPALVGFLGAIADTVGAIGWLGKNWSWLMSWADTDLFRLLFATLVLVTLGYGVFRGLEQIKFDNEKERAQSDAAHQSLLSVQESAAAGLLDAQDRIAREHREALKIPMMMASAEFFSRELQTFDLAIAQFDRRIEDYLEHNKMWEVEVPFDVHATVLPKQPHDFFSLPLINAGPFYSFHLPHWQNISWQTANVVRTPKHSEPPMERISTYEPSKNRELQIALAANVRTARALYQEWVQTRDDAASRLSQLHRQINEGTRRYGLQS